MPETKFVVAGIVEFIVYNIVLVTFRMWNPIAFMAGSMGFGLAAAFTWLKWRFGYYEGKEINPQLTVVMSSGFTLLTVFLVMLLVRWRASM